MNAIAITLRDRKRVLILRAHIGARGKIEACAGKISLLQSFSREGEELLLWYNDDCGSTHICRERGSHVD